MTLHICILLMDGKTLLAQGHRGETTPKLFLIFPCFKYLLKCLPDRYLVHSSHSNAWKLISSNMWNTLNSQFNTQQLVSMLSDIIRRDPAAANQSPVSSAACWWAWNDGVRGMPSTCADIISVTISFTTKWIFAIKRKSSAFTDSLTRDLFLFVCCCCSCPPASAGIHSQTNKDGDQPETLTILSQLIHQPLLFSSDQTPSRSKSLSVVQCSCYQLAIIRK